MWIFMNETKIETNLIEGRKIQLTTPRKWIVLEDEFLKKITINFF